RWRPETARRRGRGRVAPARPGGAGRARRAGRGAGSRAARAWPRPAPPPPAPRRRRDPRGSRSTWLLEERRAGLRLGGGRDLHGRIQGEDLLHPELIGRAERGAPEHDGGCDESGGQGLHGGIPLALVAGGLVLLLLDRVFPGEVLGYGFPRFLEMLHLQGARVKRRWMVVKTLGSAVSLGAGAAVGREGPIAQIGGSIGSAV